MISRRRMLASTATLLAASKLLPGQGRGGQGSGTYRPVVTPNGASLPFEVEGGVKVFRLRAEPVKHEVAPGLVLNCWGYNGRTPGPTIEAVEGDRVRIHLTNALPEATSVHWHGLLLPNGMDGVAGLTQRGVEPGETCVYEFTLRQHGTQLYHPHADEMTQIALGMMGFFVIHPRTAPEEPVHRDYCLLVHEWAVKAGASTPDPTVMTDFNLFTFNSRAYPGTEHLPATLGERVRLRLGNLSMDSHPLHLHGHRFQVTGTDGGPVPPSARFSETTLNVPVGATRDIEFVADNPGDWAFHCHKTHHTMNQMGHGLPNMLGAREEAGVSTLVPGYMPMGQGGYGERMSMGGPANSISMLGGEGPYGPLEMGGMFTIIKVREGSAFAGWYDAPSGTRARVSAK
jgi:FtsP/CotA-like multicopper oxidase with cupredoxin domain